MTATQNNPMTNANDDDRGELELDDNLQRALDLFEDLAESDALPNPLRKRAARAAQDAYAIIHHRRQRTFTERREALKGKGRGNGGAA